MTSLAKNTFNHLPIIGAMIVAGVMASAWVMDMSQAWKDSQSQTPDTHIKQEKLPAGCVRMDTISICDAPKETSITTLEGTDFLKICALGAYPDFDGASKIEPARPEAMAALHWMMNQVGLEANFTLVAGTFSKKVIAFAVIADNQRYIVYDKAENFFAPDGVIYWPSLAVLAHELGHHLAGHTFVRNRSSHAQELEADRFAGFMLSRLGASLNQALAITAKLNENDTPTHPARSKRIVAITNGWKLAQSQQTGFSFNATL